MADAPLDNVALSNRLALCFAAYRSGDSDGAYDLFIASMEKRLDSGEAAELQLDSEVYTAQVGAVLTAALTTPLDFEHAEPIVTHGHRPGLTRLPVQASKAHEASEPIVDAPLYSPVLARLDELLEL